MEINRNIIRAKVECIISETLKKGTWEGHQLDIKQAFDNTPSGHAKLIKLLLAFANTPREPRLGSGMDI